MIKLINDIASSYWFVPMCMVLGAMGLGLGLGWLDANQATGWLPWQIHANADDARTLLSVVATSVLGVAGVTFSITVVAVSFASSNYGPRLINNFMGDKGSQYTLGTFIGTFVYCLTVLTNLHGPYTTESGEQIDAFIPNLSLSVALLLSLASIYVLIYFINHITEIINIENITASIGHSLTNRINKPFPNRGSHIPRIDEPDFQTAIHGRNMHSVKAETIGYIQAIDLDRLSSLTQEQDLLIRIHYRPGDFTTTHDCLLSLWTGSDEDISHDSLRECFATGQERTEHQNVLFLAEQLSEVIARALSPGINDPFTAISCMNWFRTALMEYLSDGYSTSTDHSDANDDSRPARIQLTPIDLSRLCAVMFDYTRQYVAADRNTSLHTLALIAECAWHAGPGPSRTLLLMHLDKLHKSSLSCMAGNVESQDITRRYEEALSIFSSKRDINEVRACATWFGGSA
ncbi:DUF2254 domain-containing protein [Granulosicoccus antarcticus]|uniref:DUF2254 domain-containing protein n=1 Tax=Granulosicoccus antarcticus TaxID=437505 RepID=UPI0012FDF6B9|nr:DUF2254 domain-containing protein [Granulosicoccus antarcticus]